MEDDEESAVEEEIEEEVAEEIEEEETTLHEEAPSTPTPTTPPTPAQPAAEPKVSETEESEPPQTESDSEGVTVVATTPKRKSRMPKPVSRIMVAWCSVPKFRRLGSYVQPQMKSGGDFRNW